MTEMNSGTGEWMEYRGKVRDFVVENFLFGDDAGLQDDTLFLEKGIVDSTGILELVGYLETTFGVRVEDDEIVPDNLNSLNNICRYLERKISSPKPV